MDRRTCFRIAAALGAAMWGLVAEPVSAAVPARRATWKRAVATAYGPGLYGRRTADGRILTASTVGIAHRTLRLGTLLSVSLPGRPAVHARVIDRGPYGSRSTIDLTEATIKRMGFSSARTFGVRSVVWDYA